MAQREIFVTKIQTKTKIQMSLMGKFIQICIHFFKNLKIEEWTSFLFG